jgi:hypothetical protein
VPTSEITIISKKLNGNNMIILAYVWILFIILTTVFLFIASVIEKNFDESHPVKKWWRNNVIGLDPERPRSTEDDIQE